MAPKDLPDIAPKEFPSPWEIDGGGNGHYYITDANKKDVAHIYCWDEKYFNELEEKIKTINKNG
jgi:hypothetical protein